MLMFPVLFQSVSNQMRRRRLSGAKQIEISVAESWVELNVKPCVLLLTNEWKCDDATESVIT